MGDFKGVLMGMVVAAVIYMADRYLPKWFGAVPSLAFLVLIIYIGIKTIVTGSDTSWWSLLTILLVGEAVFIGIWGRATDNRNKKAQKEIEKMKAQDLS